MREIVTKEHFRLAMELQTLRLTVWLGSVIVVGFVIGFGALAALIKLL